MIREVETSHVHDAQVNRAPELLCALPGAGQHRRAEVDADDAHARRIERDVAPSAHTRIEDPARQSLEKERANVAVATVLERQIENVIEWSDALVSIQG